MSAPANKANDDRSAPPSRLAWLARYAAPTALLALFGVLIFGRSVPVVSGFSLEGQRWPVGAAVVLSLQLGSPVGGPLTDGSTSYDVVAQQAANLWNNYLGSNVRFIPTTNGLGPSANTDGMTSVFFNNNYFGTNFGSGTLAITVYSFYSDQTFADVDVVFNTSYDWDSFRGSSPLQGSNNIYDFRRVVIHEFGHVLGLDHPDQAMPVQSVTAIMNSRVSSGIDIMQTDDISGVHAIYNGPTTSPTPTPTPTPIPLGGQTLSGAVGHVYSSPGEPVGRGAEANIDASGGYNVVYYRRDTEAGTGRRLHRFIFPQNNVAGTGEWVFTFATPAGQDLADGTYNIVSSDQTNPASKFIVVSLESTYSTVAPAAQLVLRGVTYSGSNLTNIAADFRITQSTTAAAPQFLAGQLRYNTTGTPVPLPAARIVNLSTRVNVGPDAAQAIAGFVISDPSSFGKEALVRVLGPGLVPRGVTGVLTDPVVNLYTGATFLMRNDDWQDGQAIPSQSPVVQLGLEPPARTESILLNRFTNTSGTSGAYTAVVSGLDQSNQPNGTGVGLVEVYDLEIGSAATLINVSTRGQVGTGANVMIGGFVIVGPGTKKVIVRAIGPSLAAFGVAGALQNPTVTLYNSAAQVIGQNDDYAQNSASDQVAIAAKNLVPSDARESAIYKVLAPGAYSAIVSGVGGTTGIGLVEIYDAD